MALGAILGGLGSTLFGDALSGVGMKLGDALGFSFTDKMFGSGEGAANNALNLVMEQVPGLLRELNTNAMGLTGDAARNDASLYQGSFGPSAAQVSGRNRAYSVADRLMSQAISNQATGQRALGRQLGAQTQRGASAIRAATSGNPAATASFFSEMADKTANAQLSGQQQAGQQYAQSLAGAARIGSQAENVYEQGLAGRYQREVLPHLNQFQNIGSVLGPAAGAMGDSMRVAGQYHPHNLFAGATALGHNFGGKWANLGLISQWFEDLLAGNETPEMGGGPGINYGSYPPASARGPVINYGSHPPAPAGYNWGE